MLSLFVLSVMHQVKKSLLKNHYPALSPQKIPAVKTCLMQTMMMRKCYQARVSEEALL